MLLRGVVVVILTLVSIPFATLNAREFTREELNSLILKMKSDPRLQPIFEFYKKVDEEAKMENLAKDPAKVAMIAEHPALYATHGLQHVEDVAFKGVSMLQSMNGVHIEQASGDTYLFMQSLEFANGFLHDIGMHNLSLEGRAIHPDFATQFMFSEQGARAAEAFYEILPGVKEKLKSVYPKASDAQRMEIFRQVLSMSNTHSKSRIPTTLLNNPSELAKAMRQVASSSLQSTELELRKKKSGDANAQAKETLAAYTSLSENFKRQHGADGAEAYQFLDGTVPGADPQEQKDFVNSIINTERVLAIADASRKRGVNLRASGYHPIALNADDGSAIVFLDVDKGVSYRMRTESPFTVGEAKINNVYFGEDGNLHITLEPGKLSEKAREKVAKAVGFIVEDIYKDAFGRLDYGDGVARKEPGGSFRTGKGEELKIVLEDPVDDVGFGDLVRSQMKDAKLKSLTSSVRSIFSPPVSAESEQKLFKSSTLHLDNDHLAGVKSSLIDHGYDASQVKSLEGTRIVRIKPGEKMITTGTTSPYVYIPLDDGLKAQRGQDAGGDYVIRPFEMIGEQGVYRNAQRSTDVVNTSIKAVEAIAIPREIFLDPKNGWQRLSSPEEVSRKLSDFFEDKELRRQAKENKEVYAHRSRGSERAGYFDYSNESPDPHFRDAALAHDLSTKKNNSLFLNLSAQTTESQKAKLLKSIEKQPGLSMIVVDYKGVEPGVASDFISSVAKAAQGKKVIAVFDHEDSRRNSVIESLRKDLNVQVQQSDASHVVSLGDGNYYAMQPVLKGQNINKFIDPSAVEGEGYKIPSDAKTFVQSSPAEVEGHITNRDTGNDLSIIGISPTNEANLGAALANGNRSYLLDAAHLSGDAAGFAPMNQFRGKDYDGPSFPWGNEVTTRTSSTSALQQRGMTETRSSFNPAQRGWPQRRSANLCKKTLGQ